MQIEYKCSSNSCLQHKIDLSFKRSHTAASLAESWNVSQDKIKNFANVLAYCFSRDSVFEPLAIFRDISDCYYYDDIIF